MTAYSKTTAEIQALHQHQEQLDQAQQKVQKLTTAITACGAMAKELQLHQDALARLQTQHQDLLADIATGAQLDEERTALEAQIAGVQQVLQKLQSETAVEQTLAGLQRKLEQAQAELAQIQEKNHGLLRQLVKAEAEILGHEYATIAQALYDRWMRVRTLSELWLRYGGHLPLSGRFEMQIPTMQLDAVKRFKHDFHNPEVLLKSDAPYAHVLLKVREEEARLMAAGVLLPSADE